MKTFINFSNHPSKKWGKDQIETAERYGEIVDIPFPQVAADASIEEVKKIAEECINTILKQEPAAVMCQGEFTLTFAVVKGLQKQGIPCYSACSSRNTVEKQLEDGSIEKTAVFTFTMFREYDKTE